MVRHLDDREIDKILQRLKDMGAPDGLLDAALEQSPILILGHLHVVMKTDEGVKVTSVDVHSGLVDSRVPGQWPPKEQRDMFAKTFAKSLRKQLMNILDGKSKDTTNVQVHEIREPKNGRTKEPIH